MKHLVTWNSIHDRYERLQEKKETLEAIKAKMNDFSGEMGELEELFGILKEARDDLVEALVDKKRKKVELDERKERQGALIIEWAACRNEALAGSYDIAESKDEPQLKTTKKNPSLASVFLRDETSAFKAAIERGDNQ